MTPNACNFQASFMTWDKPPLQDDPRPYSRHNTPLGNSARIQLEALLDVTDSATGETERFYLIAPCRAEWVYAEDRLFQIPSREYRCVYSRSRERSVGRRILWDGKRSSSSPAEGWSLEIDVQLFSETGVHEFPADICAATARNVPLNGRTEIQHPNKDYRCLLEYPIKTMNFRPETPSFQVDTGPLILPDFSSTAEHFIDRLEMAHIAYNRLDRAEFIVRRPTPVTEEDDDEKQPRVLHYSEIQEFTAKTQILSGES